MVDALWGKLDEGIKVWYFVSDYYISKNYPSLHDFVFDEEDMYPKDEIVEYGFEAYIVLEGNAEQIQEAEKAQDDKLLNWWINYIDKNIRAEKHQREDNFQTRLNIFNYANIYRYLNMVDVDELRLSIVKYASSVVNEEKNTTLKVACPVTVNIYNKADCALVSSISTENIEDCADSPYFMVYTYGKNNETKCVVFSSEDYYMEILPYEDGNMNVSVDFGNGKGYVYNNVEITNDQPYYIESLNEDLFEVIDSEGALLEPDDMVNAERISINSDDIICNVGDEIMLTAAIYPKYANDNIIWEIKDQSYGSIDSDGNFKALAAGTTKIIARVSSNRDIFREIEVKILDLDLDKIAQNSIVHVTKNESIKLEIDGLSEVNIKTFSWYSKNPQVAVISKDGYVIGYEVGTAEITAEYKNIVITVNVIVDEVEYKVTSISLNKSTLSLDAFEDYTLTASIYPDNAANKSVEWTSSDETVATVSQDGKVTPLSKGTAVITVTAKDGSARCDKCTVTVTSEGQLCTQCSELESAHNYANNTNKIWNYEHSGAKTLAITFDSKTDVDDGFDFIYIYDKDNKEIKKATGTELAGQTIQITGDTVKIKLVSDKTITAWGFKVTKISADGKIIDAGEEKPEETKTSTEEASTEESLTEESAAEESSKKESSTEKSSNEETSTEEKPSEEKSELDEPTQDGFCIIGLKAQTYTGNAVKQNLKVYYNKHLLQEGSDYTLSYKNNKDVGQASVTVKSKKNLTGSVTKTFQIEPRKINDINVIIEDAVYIYNKKTHKKAPTITYNGKKLKEGKDYEVVEYGDGDYTAVGTYTVKIKGIGNFSESFDNAKVIIAEKDKDISKAKISKIPVQEYQNGAKVELADNLLQVHLNKTTLKKDIDYTVSYVNNTDAGKATLIIKGKGSFVGTKKMNFTIKRTPIVLTDSMVMNKSSINSVAIQKNGTMPKPKLVSNGYTLAEGKDYTLSYKNNKKIGTGIVNVKGKGNYTGRFEIPFQITTKDLTDVGISIRVPDVPYTEKPNQYQSNPVLTDIDGGVLTKNKDYTIEAYYARETVLDKKSSPKEGTVITVTIKGTGSYTGTVNKTYTLRGIDLSKAAIKVKSKPYTGNPVTIEASDIISATINTGKTKTNLKMGTDYEIADYSNNLKKGTATVTFKGIGAYAGEKTVKFKIDFAKIE